MIPPISWAMWIMFIKQIIIPPKTVGLKFGKNFRRMDYFYIMPLPQDLALEIANQWRYQPPLDAYTISATPRLMLR